MISQLTGTITAIKDNAVVLLVSGIGFEIVVSTPSNLAGKKEATLYTYMDWNQENGPSLYGFINQEEKIIFTLITSCHGIGPKIALSMLHDMNPNQIIQAITSNDIKTLSNVNGIGPKKAEQMIVQLKHKIEKLIVSGIEFKHDPTIAHWNDLSQALNALNYSRTEINQAIAYIRQAQQHNASFDQLLRQALSFLAQTR